MRVRVVPRARRTEITGASEGELVVRLQAPPVDGLANEALVAFLAQQVGARRSQVSLASGERSRHKVVRFHGVPRPSSGAWQELAGGQEKE